MKYMVYHLQIRNDFHCPTCRQPKVFFYNTLEEAYNKACNYIGNMDDFDREMLKKGSSIWIDEWIRRKNGDEYQIIKITTNKEYELLKYENEKFNLDSDVDENSDVNEDSNVDENIIKYMLLHIKVKTSKWCPNNIKYFVSFYFTLENACDFADIGDKTNLLKNLESVWINKNKIDVGLCSKGGDYFQIIELESDKKINLNKCCEQLKKLKYN
ncbi:hypothetical protein [Acanthamoeba castellanii mimivirus]|uniref:Uncharacterized protein L43 n=5 Tax=Mimivirus TaxID=315393 RepID=YL043_MIMIV|nr:hypothetical protein MIMI_gp0054 [Acanthamoeba polyphaga mimivirus]Q5UPB8.1 RecName: Full=Uncharacterized protein L43 [Acanthamoeba polyphaga mimivirus]AEQ60212.1 hypothetical protein [Acanthamoeba castellanii mamavirus]AHA45840.1 hypothetical protein HIRU_S934 [Hirudovirus strain Sangsue]AHJ39866.2 hypothetical protein [Samba virus]AMZ02494.1 hypothetical protein [Mimivirus Bombay]EJN41249.1 hypothetical protein lvs_L20 [Acanthamoeba polyphaga lentillevirus]BAV61122.1 hypothetical protei